MSFIHSLWLLCALLVEDCFHLLMYYCCCLIIDGFTGLILCYCLAFWEILRIHLVSHWRRLAAAFVQRVLCFARFDLFAWGRLARFWNCRFYVGLVVELGRCIIGFERRRSLLAVVVITMQDVDFRDGVSHNCRCSLRASPGCHGDLA